MNFKECPGWFSEYSPNVKDSFKLQNDKKQQYKYNESSLYDAYICVIS